MLLHHKNRLADVSVTFFSLDIGFCLWLTSFPEMCECYQKYQNILNVDFGWQQMLLPVELILL